MAMEGESKLLQMCQAVEQLGQVEERTRSLVQEVLKKVQEWKEHTDGPGQDSSQIPEENRVE